MKKEIGVAIEGRRQIPEIGNLKAGRMPCHVGNMKTECHLRNTSSSRLIGNLKINLPRQFLLVLLILSKNSAAKKVISVKRTCHRQCLRAFQKKRTQSQSQKSHFEPSSPGKPTHKTERGSFEPQQRVPCKDVSN